MAEIALTALMLSCAAGILENILRIHNKLPGHYCDTLYGINIALYISWIEICVAALCAGGSFAAAAISVATVWIIIGIVGDTIELTKYKSIYDALRFTIHIVLLIMFLSIGD